MIAPLVFTNPNGAEDIRMMVSPWYIITWLHEWNIEYRNTLEDYRGLNGLGVERAADESSSSLCWCLAFTASTLHSLCPDVFLNACAGGWMVEVWCGSLPEIRVRLKLALSNVAIHWTVKVDFWISRNRPIVDIRSSRRGGVYRGFSGERRSQGCRVEVEDSITRGVPLEGPPSDNLRATKWSSKVSRR